MFQLLALLSPHAVAAEEPGEPAESDVHVPRDREAFLPDRLAPVELHAWARAGYAVQNAEDELRHGPYLSMARLQAVVDHQDRYGVTLQLAADRAELQLMDAKAHAAITDGLRLTVGRMKVPVSHDFLVPVQEMLLPTRALLDRLAPARAVGLQLSADHTTAFGHTLFRLGVFDPLDSALEVPSGARIATQGALHLDNGLFAHAAGAIWLRDQTELPSVAELKHPWDLTGDLAVGLENEHASVHLEGLVSHPVDGGALQGGATAMCGVRLEVEHDHHIVLEPVGAYDLRDDGQELTHRGTLAVNVHEDGWHLLQTVAIEMEKVGDGPVGGRVVMQIQAGL